MSRKPQKVKRYKDIHRRGTQRSKRKTVFTVGGLLLGSLALVIIGYGAMLAINKYLDGEITFVPPESSNTAPGISGPAVEPAPEPPPSPVQTEANTFALSIAQVKDEAVFLAKLEEARAAGFNYIFFELKDTAGALHYISASEAVTISGAVQPDAINLAEKIAKIKEYGMLAMISITCFEDNTASRVIANSFVRFRGDLNYRWIDNDADKGGRSWLSPEAPSAQGYISAIVAEVASFGADVIVLEKFHYPVGFGVDLSYAGERSETQKEAVLAEFSLALHESLAGSETKLWLRAGSVAILNGDADLYGGDTTSFSFDGYIINLFEKPMTNPVNIGGEEVALSEDPFAQTAPIFVSKIMEKLGKKPLVFVILLDKAEEERLKNVIKVIDFVYVLEYN